MRQSFKHAGYVVATVLLALAGMVTVTGTASAFPQHADTDTDLRVSGCAFTGCVLDAVVVDSGTTVTTFCLRNEHNVIYTGSATGRGGFVHRSVLVSGDENDQTADCQSANSGVFASVGVGSANLRSCNGNCVDIGDAFLNDLTTVFCQLGDNPPGPADNRWFLLYVSDTRNAGFLPATALAQTPNVVNCNSA